MALAAPKSKIDFDPDGSVVLLLRLKDKAYQYKVNAHILAFVSPVFKALFYTHGLFRKDELHFSSVRSTPAQISIEELHNVDPTALKFALYVAHHMVDMVPVFADLTGDQIYNLAVVFDKYEFSDGMKKAAGFRLVPPGTKSRYLALRRKLDACQIHFVAFVFGLEASYREASKRLILEAKFHDCKVALEPEEESDCMYTIREMDGRLRVLQVGDDGIPFSRALPGSCYESISSRRKQTLEVLFDKAQAFLKKYEDSILPSGSLQPKINCKLEPPNEDCDAVILGFIIKNFKRIGFYPTDLRDVETKYDSIYEIGRRIEEFHIPFFYTQINEGCCKNPLKPTENDLCRNCQNKYTKRKTIDHRETCSPVREFKDLMEGIVSQVKGLELADVKQPSPNTLFPDKLRSW